MDLLLIGASEPRGQTTTAPTLICVGCPLSRLLLPMVCHHTNERRYVSSPIGVTPIKEEFFGRLPRLSGCVDIMPMPEMSDQCQRTACPPVEGFQAHLKLICQIPSFLSSLNSTFQTAILSCNERDDLSACARLDESRPCVHQRAPLFKRIGSPVSLLDQIADGVA
jgi:hypothetical protein